MQGEVKNRRRSEQMPKTATLVPGLSIPWQADQPTLVETLSVDTERHGEDEVPESNRQPLKKRTIVLALCHNACVHELNVFVAVACCAHQNCAPSCYNSVARLQPKLVGLWKTSAGARARLLQCSGGGVADIS